MAQFYEYLGGRMSLSEYYHRGELKSLADSKIPVREPLSGAIATWIEPLGRAGYAVLEWDLLPEHIFYNRCRSTPYNQPWEYLALHGPVGDKNVICISNLPDLLRYVWDAATHKIKYDVKLKLPTEV
jgi:hypothetical protein